MGTVPNEFKNGEEVLMEESLKEEILKEEPDEIKKLDKATKKTFGDNRIYSIWRHMKDRCYNEKNPWYYLYGGKGITVCDEWLNDWHVFRDWSWKNGYADDLSIDRIDNNKGYYPENCRFADAITQSNNTSRNVYIEYNGKKQSVRQWEHELGFPRDLLGRRLRKGWDVKRAIETPPIDSGKRRSKKDGRFLSTDEYFKELENSKKDESLTESKAEQDAFINKFGGNAFETFRKYGDRIKKLGYSNDLSYHVKNTSVEELNKILDDIDNYYLNKQNETDGKGDFEYLGEKNGYKVYKVNDYIASFYLGKNTGWCISGRYQHYNDEKNANIAEAEKHFDDYKDRGIKFYFFIGNGHKYALAVYPETFNLNRYLEDEGKMLLSTNFEVYDEQDNLNFNYANLLPLNLVSDELTLKTKDLYYGMAINDDGYLEGYYGEFEEVIIPPTVNEVGRESFFSNPYIKKLVIEKGVKNIEYCAFELCKNLKEVYIDDSVSWIGKRAFSGCKSLEEVRLPKMTLLNENIFRTCTSLKEIEIPEGVQYIEDSAFYGCEKLEKVSFPSTLKYIGHGAFLNCQRLKEVTIKGPVRVENNAFDPDYLYRVYLDNPRTKEWFEKINDFADIEEEDEINILPLNESLTEGILTNNIYITASPYRVRDLLTRSKEPVRILYDINGDFYMMGDANEYIHRDLIEKAIMDGWYGNKLKRYEIDSYVYDDYDEDDNMKQNVVYIVYTPKGNNDTVGGEIGSDGYFDKYDYEIGSILTRDDYYDKWEETELSKILGSRKAHTYKTGWDDNGNPIIATEGVEMKRLTEDIAAVMKNYPKIPEDVFYQIIKLDPTYKDGSNSVGTYGKWLLNLFNKKVLKKEDFYKVPDYLKEFESKKRWMTNKDIGQFKSLGDLAQALENTQEGELSQNQKNRQFKKEIKQADLNADLVYEDDKWEVWTPNDYESSCKIATDTQWCTGPSSSGNSYYYDKYTSSGPLYIIINKNDPKEKYQFHFPTKQYMNRFDRGIDKDGFLDNNPGLKEFFKGEESKVNELLKQKVKEKTKELMDKFEAGELDNHAYLVQVTNALTDIFGEDEYDTIFTEAGRDIYEIALPPVNNFKVWADEMEISDSYSNNKRSDIRSDFLRACFSEDLYDQFYWEDEAIGIRRADLSIIDEYTEDLLEAYGFPKNIYSLIKDGICPEEFEEYESDLIDCLTVASSEASRIGSINECLKDFKDSIDDAVEDGLYTEGLEWKISSDGVCFTSLPYDTLIKISSELGYNLYYYSENFVESLQRTLAEVIAENMRFYEPQYGWYDFDEDVFNESLQEHIEELASIHSLKNKNESMSEEIKESLSPKGDIKDQRILDLIDECIEKLEDMGYDIENDIQFKYGSGTTTLGTMTMPPYDFQRYTLTLNNNLFNLSDETIKNTIYHELCHYIINKKLLEKGIYLYNDNGRLCRNNKLYRQGTHGPHGTWWQSLAQKIGSRTNQDITRLSDNEEVTTNLNSKKTYKYQVTCKNCGNEIKYMKATEFVKNPNAKSKYGDWYKWACGKCHAKGQFEVKKL